MALIRTSGFITEIAGKVGGTTFQRNRYGQIAKNTPHITVRRTPLTNPRRSQWQVQSRRWAQLSEANRVLWRAAAPLIEWTNKFGDKVELTGFNLFMQRNALAHLLDLGDIDQPGTAEPIPEIAGAALISDLPGNKFSIIWTSGAVPVGYVFGVMASRPLSPGIENPREQFRFIGYFAAGTTSSQDFYTEYAEVWPEFADSTGKFWIQLLPVRVSSAMPGVQVMASFIDPI